MSGAMHTPSFKNCEEGAIKFRKTGYGEYAVYSNCLTGEMEFIGYVEKNDRPMFDDRWWGRVPGRKERYSASTRLDCAERMIG